MTKQTFHFSIGPVQSFVAEARRTRDLWAGSYILSYLSGVAMARIVELGGSIAYPEITENRLFQAINDVSKEIKPDDMEARIGLLPNRFKAEAVDPANVAASAADQVRREWRGISGAVFELFRNEAAVTDTLQEIWTRQVENQWEIMWAVGGEGFLLDQRKNLRIHYPEDEPGEKCTICGERQALSPNGQDDARDDVRQYWAEVTDAFNKERGYHFRRSEDRHNRRSGRERLCAVCTIKRLFPLVKSERHGGPVRWDFYHNYPSTAFMSAVDWLIDVLGKARLDSEKVGKALKRFIDVAVTAEVPFDEKATRIKRIEDLCAGHPEWEKISDFRGDVFFPDTITNSKDFPLNEAVDPDIRTKLLEALKGLTDAVNNKPTPFYALLIMDGDKMGQLLSDYPSEQGHLSEALNEFAESAVRIVEEKNDGKLLYAGGDDVMALLPLNKALLCSWMLQAAYVNSFENHVHVIRRAGRGTISAGIVYAHMTTPLQKVVREAHEVLDAVAKERIGRDAFAVRVWKRGGPVLTFGKKWTETSDGSVIKWAEEIEAIKEYFKQDGPGLQHYTTGFVHRFGELNDYLKELDDDSSIALLTAEYLGSRGDLGLPDEGEARTEKARERVGRFYRLSVNMAVDESGGRLPTADGPMFMKFLAQKEM
ncbi:MAG: type III-B CRISPR-associated protein Cas10/Cmr2 [Nitrospirota bacterium]|nr:type III-B CRISPR-associated protein Cas10/Cmr2 [Nitrospirota bacterium]